MFNNVFLYTSITIILILVLLCIYFRRKYYKVNKNCIKIKAQVLEVEEENIDNLKSTIKNCTFLPSK